MIKRVKVVPTEATNFHRDSTIRSSEKAKEKNRSLPTCPDTKVKIDFTLQCNEDTA